MCAIIDASVASLIFDTGCENKEAAIKFFDRVQNDKLRIVTGGKNMRELFHIRDAREWFVESFRNGRVRVQNEKEISFETEKLKNVRKLESNDQHIIALAKVSGARLLCTSDKPLMNDFRKVSLLKPKGKVYKIRKHGKFDRHHRRLLDRNNCMP